MRLFFIIIHFLFWRQLHPKDFYYSTFCLFLYFRKILQGRELWLQNSYKSIMMVYTIKASVRVFPLSCTFWFCYHSYNTFCWMGTLTGCCYSFMWWQHIHQLGRMHKLFMFNADWKLKTENWKPKVKNSMEKFHRNSYTKFIRVSIEFFFIIFTSSFC